jgi:hypothetical protein
VSETLTLALERDDEDHPVLRCIGSAEAESHDAMRVALDTFHGTAVDTSAGKVILDLRALEFASASCVLLLVQWSQRVEDLDESMRYQIVVRSDPHVPWQRRGVPLLASAASRVVVLE